MWNLLNRREYVKERKNRIKTFVASIYLSF